MGSRLKRQTNPRQVFNPLGLGSMTKYLQRIFQIPIDLLRDRTLRVVRGICDMGNSSLKTQNLNLFTTEDLGIFCHYGHGRTISRKKRSLQTITSCLL